MKKNSWFESVRVEIFLNHNEDCETAICASCTDIGHRDHFTKRMAEAVENEKVELRALVDGAYVQVG